MALFLPPLARRQRRARAARPRARAPAPRAAPRRTSSAARCARRRACRASPTSSASRRARSRPASPRTTCATSRTCAHVHARHRIEIDAQLVGMIEIVGAHRMRVQLEAGEVRHPGERRGVARHDLFRAAARGKAQRHDLDPRRPRCRRALLIEELAVDAVGIAHEHVGPAAGAAQRAVGHREVVAREVELRVARLRKQHLARIRDRDLAAVDQDDLGGAPASSTHRWQSIPYGSWDAAPVVA